MNSCFESMFVFYFHPFQRANIQALEVIQVKVVMVPTPKVAVDFHHNSRRKEDTHLHKEVFHPKAKLVATRPQLVAAMVDIHQQEV